MDSYSKLGRKKYNRIRVFLLKKKAYNKLGNKYSNLDCRWYNKDGTIGCTDIRCLQIDHVNGGGTREKYKMNRGNLYAAVIRDTEGKYQLLCANCNWIKRIVNKEHPTEDQ